MSTHVTPSKKQVQKHFAAAKEVICLKTNQKIDVTGISEFEFDKLSNSWTSVGGAVVFWSDTEFAKITLRTCKKCKNCNCEENEN